MSDLHTLPLVGHDIPSKPAIRATVSRRGVNWYWSYQNFVTAHGPFGSWREAYDSAYKMVTLL